MYIVNLMKKTITIIILAITVSCNKNQTSYKLEEKKNGNNSFENAQIIEYDGINGKLEKGKDYFYFMTSDKPQTIDLEVSSPTNKSITMKLFNYKRDMIKVIKEPPETNHKKEKFEEIMKGIYISPSTNENENKYYISLETDINNTAPYTLILKKREYKETDEKEPNDQISKAQVIEINSENRLYIIEGYYGQTFNPTIKSGDLKNREIDAYKITNSSYNTYLISIELSGVPSVDASIRLYDSKGNWIMIKDINIEGDGETIDKLILLPYMSYYFILTSTNAVNNIPYQLNVIAKPDDKYIEHEPNNKPINAQNIEYDKMYKGAIDYSLDVDYFTFTLPINDMIRLSYFMIDSQAINISISNDTLGTIATMSQTDEEYTNYLKRGKYYLIFERDKTKEPWKKGISKERNYQFMLSLLNSHVEMPKFENYYESYSNHYDTNEIYESSNYESYIESNFNSTNEIITNEQ